MICAAGVSRLGGMNATPLDDEQLAGVVALRANSGREMDAARDAFDQLYRRHARLLLAFLASRCPRADLDDLHQEAWKRAWDHLPGGFHGGQFRAWLYQIARNALIDHARKRRPEPLGERGEALAEGRDGAPDTPLLEHERMATLQRCLGQLDAEAAALVRARLGGEDYAAICEALQMTPARAHKVFHRAKGELRACVGGDER